MSKINQIEKSLQNIDATSFHKLVDSYLSKAYSYQIISNGTKLGEDKPTKGTPDSYVSLENGKYIFIEYTTQKSNIKNKFLDDLDKCFDKDKTGIPIESIEKIILACNSDLAPDEIKNLKDKCIEHNINCIILGNSTIANELFSSYPSIAKDLLGIAIDTGQILDYDDFIKNYNSNKFSTSLSTTLLCRKKEFKSLYTDIDNSAIALITGVVGIGKTKLALEVCKEYSERNNFIFKGILNRGADIYDDLMSYFISDNKQFLILIDDANRVKPVLEFLQEYYGKQLKNGDFKIVATVRDYAKEKILQIVPTQLNPSKFELQVLSDDSIKEIVSKEYNITDPIYLERIVDISKGNPRLALMASSVAKEKNNLNSLYDVTSLYDEYFSSIKKDLEVFNQDTILLTIVIISFFRTIDKNNQEQSKLIETVFDISASDLWKNIEELHNLEIFDLYENEVVKISDQILSTYLFYKIVFVDKKIKIDIFLENFFPQYESKFIDIINPILNTFDTQYIISELKKPINKIWNKYSNSEQNLYHVMSTFWYLKQTDILLYFKEKINSIDTEKVDIDSIDFLATTNTNALNDEILEQLVVFKYDTPQSIKNATELILLYFKKRPSKLLAVLQILANEYGFKYESYSYEYEKERSVLNTAWEYCNEGKNELISKLFIQLCKKFLKVEFEDCKWKNNQFVLQTFKLVETNKLQDMRSYIFECLSILYVDSRYQSDIIRLIKNYPFKMMSYGHGVSKVEQWDSENIIHFIQTNLDPTIYEHAKAVNKCLDRFDRHKILYKSNIRNKFQHPIYELEKIIMLDEVEISLEEPRNEDKNTDWNEIDKIKENRLAKFIESYNLSDWELLFEKCHIFISDESSDEYKFRNNLIDLFQILAKKDKSLYIQVFEKYLELSNPFNININLIDLIDILGKEETYKLLQKYSYNLKNSWLFKFFQSLPSDLINKNDIKEILALYQSSELESMPYHIKFLVKYLSIESNVFIQISKILLGRASTENESFINALSGIFESYTGIPQHLEIYFKDDLELLKQVYLLCVNKCNLFDYGSGSLNKLVTLDSSFLEKFIYKTFEKKEFTSLDDKHIDLKIFWEREDFEDIFLNIIEIIFDISKSKKIYRGGEKLKSFLSLPQGNEDIKNNRDYIIKEYINEFSEDENRIVFIFEFISELSHENRKVFIFYFIQKNASYKLFEKLSLKPSSFRWSGSRVPHLQKDKDLYISLLECTSGVNFLKHKQYIEKRILCIEEQIKSEKKRDFMSDY
jgi:hypothetical protein